VWCRSVVFGLATIILPEEKGEFFFYHLNLANWIFSIQPSDPAGRKKGKGERRRAWALPGGRAAAGTKRK